MSRILSSAQANAVYRAMCELNDVSAKLDATFGNPDNGIRIYESKWGGSGLIYVHEMSHGVVVQDENYLSQDTFSAAYGLNPDSKQ
jgi:hypothetical protein